MTQLAIWPTGPLARRTDPPTSHTALRADLSELQAAVLTQLRSPLTDDELVQRFPEACPGTIVKRRCELVRAGLVADSGAVRMTRRNRPAVVWQAS